MIRALILLAGLTLSISAYAALNTYDDQTPSTPLDNWIPRNSYQNKTKVPFSINHMDVTVAVPPGWIAWAEVNGDVSSIKVAESSALDASSLIIFLSQRTWNEKSLLSAKKTMAASGRYVSLSIEQWNGREWLVSEKYNGDNVEMSARTITVGSHFRWQFASGSRAKRARLLAIMKTVTIK